MKLSESIRHFRTMRNLTQEQLANAISISPQAISKWERGESMPDASLIPVLADALDVSLDRLYGREKYTLEDLNIAKFKCFLIKKAAEVAALQLLFQIC